MTRWTWASIGVATTVYLLAWIGWAQDWSWLATFDSWGLELFGRAAGTPNAVRAWNVFCTVFGPGVLRIAAAGVIVWLLVRRRRRVALFVFMTVEVSGLVTELAKWLADRPRPPTAMVYAYGTSFPSGHALGITVIVLTGLALMRRRRAWVVALGMLLIVGIGVGRVVLNVHNPSDVIAGWALGYLYFRLCSRFILQDETPVARGTAL